MRIGVAIVVAVAHKWVLPVPVVLSFVYLAWLARRSSEPLGGAGRR